jgi:signal transduction histidine kinase
MDSLLYLLDTTLIAVSFFNQIALIWLGLTVLLNAERRVWGTWMAGIGLLLGGLFFTVHSAIVGRVITSLDAEMHLWWPIFWLPFIFGPYLWYIVIAWYTGAARAGQRAWLPIVSLLGLAALVLLLFGTPLPSYAAIVQRAPVAMLTIAGLPVAILIYPVFSLLCIILSLSALIRPAATDRFMGDLARRRARPWLIAASLTLLLIGLVVGLAAAWFLTLVQAGDVPGPTIATIAAIMVFDLLIASLIAVVVVLVGRAVVSYEVFTGKTLPRGGLSRQWRQSLILAAGYGTLIGASLAMPGIAELDPIYRLLLATVLMTVFFALLSWRAFVDRERNIERLRPFVASQRLYDHMLHSAALPDIDAGALLRALCDDLLGAEVIYLCPTGPLAALLGPVLATAGRTQAIIPTPPSNQTTHELCVRIDPTRYGGAVWAVPLWSERGPIGVLLLGEKRDEGIYTQEEIEIARATGERLIDTSASAELARRLMQLQRERMVESQVMDRRTRRVLHDDVLPHLHTAMLALQSASYAANREPRDPPAGEPAVATATTSIDDAITTLGEVHRQISNLLHAMPTASTPDLARMGVLAALRRTVEQELGDSFEQIEWQIEPQAEQAARQLGPLAMEVVFYAAREALRNAARHGRGGTPGRPLAVLVCANLSNTHLQISISDDGIGPDPARSAIGGSGRGLALHSTLMAVIGGSLVMEAGLQQGTRVTLSTPIG